MTQRLVSILLLLCLSARVFPLGLGDIELNSGLNQPFNARIELLSPTGPEIDSLTVRLADAEAFNREGIDRLFVLTSLRFEIQVNQVGPDYILVTSRDAIREPYLNFLVEASWSNGRLIRDYTVLLDPPLYDPNARRVTTAPSSSAGPVQEITRQPVRTSTPSTPVTPTRPSASPLTPPPSSPRPARQTPAFTPSFTGDEYGPVAARTTLWSLASQIRPDASVTTQQMMLALLRANPEAFINNNINGLREGAILRVPDRNEIMSVTAEAAFSEAVSQNSIWEEMRRNFAGNAGPRPLGSESQPTGGATPTAVATSESELRLVSPGAGTGEGQTGASSESGGQTGANLALANEQLEVLSSENEDLRGQIEESEELIGDLQRLIELQDDELSAMQNQVAEADAREEGIIPGAETEPEIDITSGEIDLGINETSIETPQVVEDEPEPEPEPEPVAEVPPATTVPPAVTTAQTDTGSPAGGMVDQILGVVLENIQLVGGALGALLVAFAGLFYIKKRKATAESELDEVADAEFMDLDESEDITDISEVVDEQQEAEPEISPEFSEEQTLDALPESEPEEEIVSGFPVDDDMPASAAETSFLAMEEEEEKEQADSDEDPLAEVNVFLAYEHFDQAEEFVRNAIKRSPDNLDFHSKLLEVFYSSGDKAKYEEEARVLHGLTNGAGPHWEMALIMWQEISPNRELFGEATGSELEDSASSQSGGIVDLTSSDTSISDEDEAIDFDLGTDESEEKPQDVLDLTSTNTNIMDLTMDEDNQLEGSQPKEDILDLTIAEGFDTNEAADSEGQESPLDMSTGLENSDDDILDITARPGVQPDLDHDKEDKLDIEDEDILDITSSGLSRTTSSSDDVLDITSGSFDADSASDDDVLDITSGSFDAEPASDDDVLDLTSGSFGSDPLSDENALDIESEGLSIEDDSTAAEDSSASDSNILDFESSAKDSAAEEDFDLSLDVDEEVGGADLELSIEESASDAGSTGLELELEGDASSQGNEDLTGLSLDDEGGDDSGGLELDLDSGDDIAGLELDSGDESSNGLSLEMDTSEEDTGGSSLPEINMDDTLELPRKPSELDMESTVELPKDEVSSEESSDMDDDTTVIIPKTPGAGEQSDEDEVATKLDLAKAYVELGDNDSADTILDEILAEGNEAQKKQAQDLKSQIS